MPTEFLLPDLGEGITEAQIVRVLVKTGDTIKEDQYLMEVETDKAAVEIPSPYAGIAQKVHVEEGATINVGDVIITFAGDAETDKKPAPKKSSAPVATTDTTPSTTAQPPPRKTTKVAAAPAVRKRARELGIDLDSVEGTGPGGRITKQDLEQHIAGGTAETSQAPAAPPAAARAATAPAAPPPGEPGTDKWGPVRRAPLSQIRKTIAKQMAHSAFTAVHVTHNDEADISELDRMRRSLNDATGGDPKLTFMSFLIRATCLAIRKHPEFNASFDDDGMTYKEYVNIGIAVDTDRGLVVPVIRNVDQMTIRGIATSLRSIAERIRSNAFTIEDLRGGTFTITNVGALGGMVSTPIINYPEVAILGLGRSQMRPVVRNGEIVPALILPINLSFDHRATDGANAARFATEIISYLETPAKFLLD